MHANFEIGERVIAIVVPDSVQRTMLSKFPSLPIPLLMPPNLYNVEAVRETVFDDIDGLVDTAAMSSLRSNAG